MSWIEVLAQDLSHGFRLLGRAPQLNIAIILTLSLGIGVNLAGFPLGISLRPDWRVFGYTLSVALLAGSIDRTRRRPDFSSLR